MPDVAFLFTPTGTWPDADVWDDNLSWSDQTYRQTLLPNNATPQELALEQTTARGADVGAPIRPLWNPATCPAALLPWLAWALSVDEWEPTLTEAQQRAVIAASVGVHRRKGTVGAVRDAIAAAGLGDATLTERFGRRFYDGSRDHDGAVDHDEPDHWAEYRLELARPITIAQAAQVRRIVAAIAPLRSHLKQLDFTEAANLHDGAIRYDGTYSHGVA